MLIKNANIVTQKRVFEGCVRVKDDLIELIGEDIKPKENEKVIDAQGKYLLPKLIDTNVRLKDDTLSKKNLDELYKKAKEGGVGSFVLIDDFAPKVENPTHLELLSAKVSNGDANILLSVNSLDKEGRVNQIATFLKNGAKVIYSRSDIPGNSLVRVMQYAAMKKVPLFVFCEERDIKNNGVMNEGVVSFKLGLSGILKVAQISEVSKIVELATFFGVKVLFQSIYTSKSLKILKAVKKDNKDVFAEVSIHSFILNDSECDGFNTKAKLISPLQEESEKQELLELLKSGVVDVITSEHSKKSYIYKDIAFETAKDGVDALSLTLKLGYTFLVKKGVLAFNEFVKLIATNPANILSMPNVGFIKEGYKADMILFDDKYCEVIHDELSLYNGKELYGKIEEIR